MTLTGDNKPDYYLDVYGDSSIALVPPVYNYKYTDNISKRGKNDGVFRWEEVQIPLDVGISGLLSYVMPDKYVVQFTPDIGWHDTLAMFGDPSDNKLENPHLKNLGPYSIENGLLQDNGDGSVQVSLSSNEFSNAVIDGFDKFLWRAVPWGDGNPGKGGLPAKFKYVSSTEQLKFTVDNIVKETKKAIQVISGTKSIRSTIATQDSNIDNLIVEQTNTKWTVSFIIDRPDVLFSIISTDSGGSAVGKFIVDMNYDSSAQISNHIWNSFDGFALMASISRLPSETNSQLKARIIDAYTNKGGSHYNGLVSSVNRELGLPRIDNAMSIERAVNLQGVPYEVSIGVDSNHTRISFFSNSLKNEDEIIKIDPYTKTIRTSKRIALVDQIKTEAGVAIKDTTWSMYDSIAGDEILLENLEGSVKISYHYYEDLLYSTYPDLISLNNAINAIVNPAGTPLLLSTLDPLVGGGENSPGLYKTHRTLSEDNLSAKVGWSRVGLFKISDEEYKWSFADRNSMFFNSKFYTSVLELKSKTNIEWGFVIADKDFWDSVDSDNYGRDSLPLALDIPISNFVTPISKKADSTTKFDPWEAYRMGYYFESTLITNTGFPRSSFRSGVGGKLDCNVSAKTFSVSAESSKVNLNPIVFNPVDSLSVTIDDIQDIIIDL
jgi:hypothetical protein